MRTVRRYELRNLPLQELSLPVGGRVLDVCARNDVPVMFVLMDPNAATRICTIRIFSDDEQFDETAFKSDYRGTFILSDGSAGHIVEIS